MTDDFYSMSSEKRAIEQVETEPGSSLSVSLVTEPNLAAATPAAAPVAGLVVDQLIQPGRRRKKQKVQEIPPVPNKPGQCHFYVKAKGRYCKLVAKVTNKYCGEHSMFEGSDGNNATSLADIHLMPPAADSGAKDVRKRVPCPLDPTHTVWEDDMKAHTARCNARPKATPSFHVQDTNLTLPAPSKSDLAQDMLSKLTPAELLELVTKVETLCDKYITAPIKTMVLDHPVMEERKNTVKNIKHAHQQGSLLGHMERLGMLSDPQACFIEFGAGRGELSLYLKKALQDRGACNFVLVDRMAVRNKFDAYIAGIDQVPTKSYVRRRLMDIKDLKLSKLPETERSIGSMVAGSEDKSNNHVKEGEKSGESTEAYLPSINAGAAADAKISTATKRPVVALSKHLCGGATDITLKCLVDYKAEFETTAEEQAGAVRGILIALCCHHCCRHYMYPNQAFLQENGITERDFALITRMSSWGVSVNTTKAANPENNGEGKEDDKVNKDGTKDEDDDDEEDEHGLTDTATKDLGSNISVLTFQKRVELGLRCKRLLDVGRVQYLQQHGFDAEVVYYTDPDTSLENLALMAVPRK